MNTNKRRQVSGQGMINAAVTVPVVAAEDAAACFGAESLRRLASSSSSTIFLSPTAAEKARRKGAGALHEEPQGSGHHVAQGSDHDYVGSSITSMNGNSTGALPVAVHFISSSSIMHHTGGGMPNTKDRGQLLSHAGRESECTRFAASTTTSILDAAATPSTSTSTVRKVHLSKRGRRRFSCVHAFFVLLILLSLIGLLLSLYQFNSEDAESSGNINRHIMSNGKKNTQRGDMDDRGEADHRANEKPVAGAPKAVEHREETKNAKNNRVLHEGTRGGAIPSSPLLSSLVHSSFSSSSSSRRRRTRARVVTYSTGKDAFMCDAEASHMLTTGCPIDVIGWRDSVSPVHSSSPSHRTHGDREVRDAQDVDDLNKENINTSSTKHRKEEEDKKVRRNPYATSSKVTMSRLRAYLTYAESQGLSDADVVLGVDRDVFHMGRVFLRRRHPSASPPSSAGGGGGGEGNAKARGGEEEEEEEGEESTVGKLHTQAGRESRCNDSYTYDEIENSDYSTDGDLLLWFMRSSPASRAELDARAVRRGGTMTLYDELTAAQSDSDADDRDDGDRSDSESAPVCFSLPSHPRYTEQVSPAPRYPNWDVYGGRRAAPGHSRTPPSIEYSTTIAGANKISSEALIDNEKKEQQQKGSHRRRVCAHFSLSSSTPPILFGSNAYCMREQRHIGEACAVPYDWIEDESTRMDLLEWRRMLHRHGATEALESPSTVMKTRNPLKPVLPFHHRLTSGVFIARVWALRLFVQAYEQFLLDNPSPLRLTVASRAFDQATTTTRTMQWGTQTASTKEKIASADRNDWFCDQTVVAELYLRLRHCELLQRRWKSRTVDWMEFSPSLSFFSSTPQRRHTSGDDDGEEGLDYAVLREPPEVRYWHHVLDTALARGRGGSGGNSNPKEEEEDVDVCARGVYGLPSGLVGIDMQNRLSVELNGNSIFGEHIQIMQSKEELLPPPHVMAAWMALEKQRERRMLQRWMAKLVRKGSTNVVNDKDAAATVNVVADSNSNTNNNMDFSQCPSVPERAFTTVFDVPEGVAYHAARATRRLLQLAKNMSPITSKNKPNSNNSTTTELVIRGRKDAGRWQTPMKLTFGNSDLLESQQQQQQLPRDAATTTTTDIIQGSKDDYPLFFVNPLSGAVLSTPLMYVHDNVPWRRWCEGQRMRDALVAYVAATWNVDAPPANDADADVVVVAASTVVSGTHENPEPPPPPHRGVPPLAHHNDDDDDKSNDGRGEIDKAREKLSEEEEEGDGGQRQQQQRGEKRTVGAADIDAREVPAASSRMSELPLSSPLSLLSLSRNQTKTVLLRWLSGLLSGDTARGGVDFALRLDLSFVEDAESHASSRTFSHDRAMWKSCDDTLRRARTSLGNSSANSISYSNSSGQTAEEMLKENISACLPFYLHSARNVGSTQEECPQRRRRHRDRRTFPLLGHYSGPFKERNQKVYGTMFAWLLPTETEEEAWLPYQVEALQAAPKIRLFFSNESTEDKGNLKTHVAMQLVEEKQHNQLCGDYVGGQRWRHKPFVYTPW